MGIVQFGVYIFIPRFRAVGAGGFDSTQSTAGGTVPGEKKAEGAVPMFIKQVLESSDDGLSLFDLNMGVVTFVAIVRSVDHSSTKITYRLEDHTGQIDAHHWLEEGDTLNTPQVAINAYARVFGSVRNQSGGKTIMIFRLEPMQTINELTNHMLEVLNAYYRAEELSKGGGVGAGSDQKNNLGFGSTFGGGSSFGGGSGGVGGDNGLGLDSKHQLVYDSIKKHGTTDGISMTELRKKFSHMRPTEIE